jgi:hypothetical protein
MLGSPILALPLMRHGASRVPLGAQLVVPDIGQYYFYSAEPRRGLPPECPLEFNPLDLCTRGLAVPVSR